jgi:hypothetical protein
MDLSRGKNERARERERRMTSFLPQCLLRIGIKKREKKEMTRNKKDPHELTHPAREREREREIEDILVCTLILAYDTSGITDTHTQRRHQWVR